MPPAPRRRNCATPSTGCAAADPVTSRELGKIRQRCRIAADEYELGGDTVANTRTGQRFEDNVVAGRFNVRPETPHHAALQEWVREMRPGD